MELLTSPSITFKEAARLTGVSVSTVIRIFDQHCHIPRSPRPEALCIDEVYAPSSQYKGSKYMCILYDFYEHSIIDVLPERKKNYLHHYFQPLQHTGELNNVKYIVMDMHKTYKDISKLYLKRAVICADSFHVVKQLNDSLSKLRIRIMKRYDTDSVEYYLLKNFNYLLLDRTIDLDNKGKFNKRLNRYINYRQLLELILSIDPLLDKAWHLKEQYMDFNITCSFEKAPSELDRIIQEFILAGIPEYREFTGSLSNWRKEIINSFLKYKGRRLNNGVAESINS